MDIYLDQNQWIPLARAFHGREQNAEVVRAADLISNAVRSGAVRLPISRLHLIEATKTPDDARRRRLIEAFIHFSHGWIVRPAEVLHAEELLKWFRGEEPVAPTALGRGLLAAFGSYDDAARQLGVTADELDDLDAFAESADVWFHALTATSFRRQATQVHLTANNYAANIESVRAAWAALPEHERRVVFAEGVVQDTIEALQPAGGDLQHALARLHGWPRNDLPALLTRIPTLDVLFTLGEAKARNLSRATDPNDLWDLAFLAAALPYCAIVVTESSWAALARDTGLSVRRGSKVLPRLADLIPVLEESVPFNEGRTVQ